MQPTLESFILILKGMLASAETIRVIAEALHRHHVLNIIVDPVGLPRDVYLVQSGALLLSTIDMVLRSWLQRAGLNCFLEMLCETYVTFCFR